jgi:hypothetical protein
MNPLFDLDPSTYQRHPVHRPEFGYPDTNCWTDVVIEVLHASGNEPLAALGCTLALDHEGDQFTFFKPRQDELEALYGIAVYELQVYRPMFQHVAQQLELGRALIFEVDGWWLPDTAGASYHVQHGKTSIVVDSFTEDRLVYFHNGGVHELGREDLEQIATPGGLPGYAEVMRFDAGPRLAGEELRATARELLRDNLLRRPATSPFIGFASQLDRELDGVLAMEMPDLHTFAFATTRMAGSAAALAAAHVRWTLPTGGDAAAEVLERVGATTRTLMMRLMRRKPFDPLPLVEALATDWAEAHERLDELVR